MDENEIIYAMKMFLKSNAAGINSKVTGQLVIKHA